MKSRIEHVLFTVLMAVFLCGCGQNVNGLGTEDHIKAIRNLFDDFCEAHKYNDGARLAEFYTDDAMLMPSDEPIVSGKAAIASRYQCDLDKFTVELITNPEEIEVSGNLAFVRGTFTIKLTPKVGGDKIEVTFKAISILRKGTDGSWKLYCDIWNSDAPLPPKGQTLAPPHEFELRATGNPTKVSEGIYRVGWIRTSLPSDESRAQIIPVEMDEPYVHWPQWGLKKQDVNFDGYLDIGVCQHGGAKWGRFYWYLYDPKKMEFYTNTLTKELGELTCASFKADPETKRITITRFHGVDLTDYSYEIVNGHLSLLGSRQLIGSEGKTSLTIATVCMNAKPHKETNLKTLSKYIEQASEKGAQLVVFPEIALQQNPGWFAAQVTEDEMAYVRQTAETIPGPSTEALVELAKQHNIHVIFGMTEKSLEQDLYNTSVLLGLSGLIGKYRKQHLYTERGGNEDLFWKRGTEIGILESPFGKVGLMICIEMEDHLGGELADAGAGLLVTTTAWRGDSDKAIAWYDRLTKSNAFEAQRWHIVSNQVGPVGYVTGYGHSRIINPNGDVVADTGDKEGVVIAKIDR